MSLFADQYQFQPRCRAARRGFTLPELMITIGIIALLLSLALVGLNAAKRKAQITRVQDDFQMITTALTQYRSDFGDYPRFADPLADQATQNVLGNGNWLDSQCTDRGARLLCRALIAPGPATANLSGPPDGQDGADGPGFRVRRVNIGTTGALGGKTWGPYLAADKFKLEFNPAVKNMADAKILDSMGNVILYYPALPGPPVLYPPTNSSSSLPPAPYGYYVGPLAPLSYTAGSVTPLYNSFDNTVDTTTNKRLVDPNQMRYLLGNLSMTGSINTSAMSPEIAATTAPYLLWTAGLDGIYGFGNDPTGMAKVPGPGMKTDDITNFDFPQAVKK
jgi:prepilin-type N-terminal cleavage/methylation domain-containing protein